MTNSNFQFQYLPKRQVFYNIHYVVGFVVQTDFIQRFFGPVYPKIGQQRKLIVPKLYIVRYFGNAFYFYDIHFLVIESLVIESSSH